MVYLGTAKPVSLARLISTVTSLLPTRSNEARGIGRWSQPLVPGPDRSGPPRLPGRRRRRSILNPTWQLVCAPEREAIAIPGIEPARAVWLESSRMLTGGQSNRHAPSVRVRWWHDQLPSPRIRADADLMRRLPHAMAAPMR